MAQNRLFLHYVNDKSDSDNQINVVNGNAKGKYKYLKIVLECSNLTQSLCSTAVFSMAEFVLNHLCLMSSI